MEREGRRRAWLLLGVGIGVIGRNLSCSMSLLRAFWKDEKEAAVMERLRVTTGNVRIYITDKTSRGWEHEQQC
jgi:hypothetical protein